jgi:hypothetical protein
MFQADPDAALGAGAIGLQQLLGVLLHQLQQGPEAFAAAEFRLG